MTEQPLKTLMRRLSGDETGSIAVVFVMISLPLALMASLTIDYIRLRKMQHVMQAAADAGALSGASLNGKDAERIAVATSVAGGNLASSIPDAKLSATSVQMNAATEVTVNISATMKEGMLAGFGYSFPSVTVSATASASGRDNGACVVVLDHQTSKSLFINSNSRLDAIGCDIRVNSSSSDALFLNGSRVEARDICVYGNAIKDGASVWKPPPRWCDRISDPFASLPEPSNAADACTYNSWTIQNTFTLQPGVYCGKLELNAGADVTFAPGVYVFRGELIVNSNSRARGSDVTFFFTGSQNPRFLINSGSNVNLSASNSGTFAGILLYQSRNVNADFPSTINSASAAQLTGAIYLPRSTLIFNSFGAGGSTGGWMTLVINRLSLNSDSRLAVPSDFSSANPPAPVWRKSNRASVLLVR